VLEISQIVETRNLRNILLGRYHRPRAEESSFSLSTSRARHPWTNGSGRLRFTLPGFD